MEQLQEATLTPISPKPRKATVCRSNNREKLESSPRATTEPREPNPHDPQPYMANLKRT